MAIDPAFAGLKNCEECLLIAGIAINEITATRPMAVAPTLL